MSATLNLTKHRPVTSRDGRLLWAADDVGPRGGRRTYYAERRAQDHQPTGWELWSDTQARAGGYLTPAGNPFLR